MNSNTNEVALALLKKLGKGFNNNDANAVMDCVTDDFEWILATGPDAPHGTIVRGREANAEIQTISIGAAASARGKTGYQ